jgi:hypothetical protein
MNKMENIYHISPKRNTDSILKSGLVPPHIRGARINFSTDYAHGNDGNSVFLGNINEVRKIGYSSIMMDGWTVFKVKSEFLEANADKIEVDGCDNIAAEDRVAVKFRGVIPPEAIEVYKVGNDIKSLRQLE